MSVNQTPQHPSGFPHFNPKRKFPSLPLPTIAYNRQGERSDTPPHFSFEPCHRCGHHPSMSSLTHLDAAGHAAMVDISHKVPCLREAVAEARILLQSVTLRLIQENSMKKGDVLAVARIAGIQAAKQTQHLIPLCHQISLSKAAVDFEFQEDSIRITATARTTSATGVEMEALTATSIAALTIYDMCKAVDKTMQVTDLRLLSKTKTPLPVSAE